VPCKTRRDGSLAAALLRLIDRDAESDDPRMSKDDESDGLDALASGLTANESDDADEELDLASLAAVVGARAPSSAGDQPAPAEGDKVVLNAAPVPSAPAPVPAPAPAALAPAAPAQRSWLVPTLVAFAIGVGVMGYVLGRSSRMEERAVAGAEPAPAESIGSAPQPAAPPPVAAAPAPAVEPVPAATPAPVAAVPVAPPEPGRAPGASTATRPPRAGAAASAPVALEAGQPSEVAAAPAEPPVEKPTEAPAALAKTEPAPSRSVDDLLDEALAPGKGRPAEPQGPAELPEAPSRDEVTQAMAVLLPAIRGCAMGQTGLATAGIVVRGDGRVASVELSGAPFEGTASGRCMEGVLRRARFSRFRQPTFRVRFPFAIQ
jgi:hypothetical protein